MDNRKWKMLDVNREWKTVSEDWEIQDEKRTTRNG